MNSSLTNYSDLLGKPAMIQGQEAILVQDIIGAVPVTEQHEYVEISKATNTCASIHMRESDLEEMRRLYPKTPVYGLWHTLVASGKVDAHVSLQVVATTEFDGHYAHSDVGRILYSGNYDAGFFAADTGFRLSSALKIQGTIEELVIPKKPAMLAREILSQKRNLYRGHFLQFAAVAAVLLFMAFVIDFSLKLYSEQDFASIVEKDKQLKKISKDLRSLSKNRLVETPDQSSQLNRLALIFNDFEEVEVDTTIQLRSKKIILLVTSAEDPTLLYDFVTSEIQPDGRWAVTMKLRG